MIYESWDDIPEIGKSQHDEIYLNILKKHGFSNNKVVVPLKGRYTKARRWTIQEFEEIVYSWKNNISLTFVSACLNRNPQDMIYKLLAYCKSNGLEFTQKGRSEGSILWNEDVRACALELFLCGLPAWKIAVLFRVDFEHVEKEMFLNRSQYGHQKKNPFGINTDHKQLVNSMVLNGSDIKIKKVFEPFAGEGRFTKALVECPFVENILAIEKDVDTFKVLKSAVVDSRITYINADNLSHFDVSRYGRFDLIDLDPFVTCHEQLRVVWDLLADDAYLFITFGGEYRRSFIKTNRQSIYMRYGYLNLELKNSDYLETVPFYFLGSVAAVAAQNNITFSVVRAVRYANNCRFWLRVSRVSSGISNKWLSDNTLKDEYGMLFKKIAIPRFREVRSEIDQLNLFKD